MAVYDDYHLSANLSLLFTEHPLLDRFAAAAGAGFDAVELWWPFAEAVPARTVIDDFVDAVLASGVRLSALNLFGGDMPAGERGIASAPARRGEFAANVEVVVEIAQRTGCRLFNALYGARDPAGDPVEQDATATANLGAAAAAVASFGGRLLLEPLSGVPGYPITTAAHAVAVIDRVRSTSGHDDLALLVDTFHLTNNGEDPAAVVRRFASLVGHVQFADAPGRGAPGSGRVDFAAVVASLRAVGYDGLIACEYVPGETSTDASMVWIGSLAGVRLPGRGAVSGS